MHFGKGTLEYQRLPKQFEKVYTLDITVIQSSVEKALSSRREWKRNLKKEQAPGIPKRARMQQGR